MGNKKIRIIVLSILGVVILSVLAYLLIFQRDFSWSRLNDFGYSDKVSMEETFYSDKIESITVDTKTTDISILKTNGMNIEVIGYSEKNGVFTFDNNNDGDLKVASVDKDFCVGICINDKKIEIHVPTSYTGKLIIRTRSGDIKIEDFVNNDFDIKTTSGDVYADSVKDIKVNMTSGELKLAHANILRVEATSGEVYAGINNETYIKSTSGEVNVDRSNKVNIKTTSGEVSIKELILKSNSYIKSTSGEIEVEKINDVYIDATSISGDINIRKNNRLSSLVLTVKTTSGEIEIN